MATSEMTCPNLHVFSDRRAFRISVSVNLCGCWMWGSSTRSMSVQQGRSTRNGGVLELEQVISPFLLTEKIIFCVT
jgi:hypothetical protein